MSFITQAQSKSEGTDQAPPRSYLKLADYRHIMIGSSGLLLVISISWATFNYFEQSATLKKSTTSVSNSANASGIHKEIDENKKNEKKLINKQIKASSNEVISEPSYSSLPVNYEGLNDLNITSHIYTEDPTQRAIFINNQIYRIGDEYRKAEIRDITSTGVVLRVTRNQSSNDLLISLTEKWSLR